MSYYLEKPKRKTDEFQSPLDSLLMFLGAKPTPFEFTSSLSLELCAAALKAKQRKRDLAELLLNRPFIEVEINQLDDAAYQFRVRRRQGKRLPIVATGTMERESDTSTLITGSAQPQHLFWSMVIPFIGFVIFFLIFGLINEIHFPLNVFFGVTVTAGLVLGLLSTHFERRDFICFIQETLSRPEDLLLDSDEGLR